MKGQGEYKFKFSIVMSIYNVDEYLAEAINSVIKQTIGFKENVQLILVNDGSPDNSEKICLEFQDKFPANIKYIKKENGGLSSARNEGLKYREGKYINFLDPDDVLEPNTLSEIYKFFEKNYSTIPMVAIPLYYFESMEGIHPKYMFMGNKNKIINLDTEPYNFVLSSASVFYKTELFDEFYFDEGMTGEEDTKLNFQIFKKQRSLGYVCQKGVKYNYRKRDAGNSIGDQSITNIKSYLAVITLFDDILKDVPKEDTPDYLKELILYETRSRVKNLSKSILGDNYNYIAQKYKEYIERVDKKHIIRHTKWLTTKEQQFFYLSNFLENKNIFSLNNMGFVEFKGFNVFPISVLPIQMQDMRFEKESIVFRAVYWDFNIDDIELVMKTNDGKIIEPYETVNASSPFNLKLGTNKICNATSCGFSIPYEKQKVEFYYRNIKSGELYRVNIIKVTPFFTFALRERLLSAFYKNYRVTFYKTGFSVRRHKIPSYKYNFYSFRKLFQKHKVLPIYRLFNIRNKKYILINDRPEKASDNGEALFQHIRTNRNDLRKNTYYVLDKHSADFKRLKKLGYVVKKGSIKHKLLFLNSRAILTSHLVMDFYSPFSSKEIVLYRDMLSYKLIWLQHGITQNDISVAANKYRKGLSYVVAATNKEYDEFTKPKYSFEEKNIILSGFPRYDKLKDCSKNIITIAPTWRAYLSGKISANGFHETKSGFYDSEYYKKYSQILSDEKLLNSLREKNYKLQFLLHPGMLGYLDGFKKFANDCVEIIDAKDVDYSKTFAETKLMITDYSSVFFDFAYLKKPVIYYQFDFEEFFGKHYKKGYFDYGRDGFGEVFSEHAPLIEKIKYYLDNDCKMEDVYLKRVDNTFKYTDSNNCERLLAHLREENVL